MNLLSHTRPSLSDPRRTSGIDSAATRQTHAGPPLAGRRGPHRGFRFVAVGLILVAGPALASELGASAVPTRNQIVIHDAAETLRDWCRADANGVLWLRIPGGARFELVTSVSDSVVANHGDGSFHAFDAAEVRAALTAARYPLGGIAADVFILPYPRRNGLCSAAGPGLVLLSPGVWPLPSRQQHAEFLHELGHVVQYARMPDWAVDTWDQYRSLRGIADATVYSATAPHEDRPHEIFAEDFRVLFGGPLAASTPGIENPELTPPAQVPGLASFLLTLPDALPGPVMSARPNPARGPVEFSCGGRQSTPVDVFDVAGRRLVTLSPQGSPNGTRWVWDGRDEAGRRVGPGVVFARARAARVDPGAPVAVLRVTVLP